MPSSSVFRSARFWSSLVFVIICLASAFYWIFGRGESVATVLVVRGDAAEVVYATGAVEPVRWAKVVPIQRARLIYLCECEGKAVHAGDILAQQDGSQQKAHLDELLARHDQLERDVQRLNNLLDRNAATVAAVDQAVTSMKEIDARIVAAQDVLNDLVLRSPMDGVVLREDFSVGEIIGSGDVVFWVGQSSPLRIVADINEEDVGRIKIDDVVLLRHEGFGDESLSASVSSITPKGDPVTKTFRVYLALPETTPLRIGMSVEANIIIKEKKNALLVPAEALVGQSVFVIENSRLLRRPITTGIRGTRMVEVLTGLEVGDEIISPTKPAYKEGLRVFRAEATKP